MILSCAVKFDRSLAKFKKRRIIWFKIKCKLNRIINVNAVNLIFIFLIKITSMIINAFLFINKSKMNTIVQTKTLNNIINKKQTNIQTMGFLIDHYVVSMFSLFIV